MPSTPVLDGAQIASGRKDFLPNMQILRFVAAVMVLISHLDREVRNVGLGQSVAPVMDAIGMPWNTGVDLFFCISGFLMLYLSWNHFAEPGYTLEFLKRRVIRVVPLYWIFTLAFTAVAFAAPSVLLHGDITPGRLIASLGFIPVPRKDGIIYPVLVAGWTLNYEALFYCLFGASLLLRRSLALVVLALGFAALSLWHMMSPPGFPPLLFWSDPIILEFIFGMAAAFLYIRGARLALPVRVLLVAAGFALWIVLDKVGLADTETHGTFLPRSVWAGLPAVLILIAALFGPQADGRSRVTRLLVLGGNASYALYLSHMFATRAVSIVWRALHLHSGWGFMAVGLVAAVSLSVAVYLWIETPLLARLRQRFEPRRALLAA